MDNNEFSELNKGNFKVPDGYFDQIGDTILDKLNSASPGSQIININKVVRPKNIWRKIILATTSVAACATFIFFYNKNESMDMYNLSKLENTEIINYLYENADDVELDYLAEKSNTGSNAFELTDTDFKDINKDDLIDDVNIEELF